MERCFIGRVLYRGTLDRGNLSKRGILLQSRKLFHGGTVVNRKRLFFIRRTGRVSAGGSPARFPLRHAKHARSVDFIWHDLMNSRPPVALR